VERSNNHQCRRGNCNLDILGVHRRPPILTLLLGQETSWLVCGILFILPVKEIHQRVALFHIRVGLHFIPIFLHFTSFFRPVPNAHPKPLCWASIVRIVGASFQMLSSFLKQIALNPHTAEVCMSRTRVNNGPRKVTLPYLSSFLSPQWNSLPSKSLLRRSALGPARRDDDAAWSPPALKLAKSGEENAICRHQRIWHLFGPEES
jgi:hypothetical protein